MSRLLFLNAERVDWARDLDFTPLEVAMTSVQGRQALSNKVSGNRVVDAIYRPEVSAGILSPQDIAALVTPLHAVVVTKEMPVTAETIDALPDSVKLIVEAGTGFNNIDLDAATSKNIKVCNVPAYSTDAVASLVMTFVLSLSCSMQTTQRRWQSGDTDSWKDLGILPHFELAGKTIGLVGGRGAIGSRVADLARAFGMHVLISSRSSAPCGKEGVEVVNLDDLLARSDFVSVHCPSNAETRGLIGAPQFARMKTTAYLINTARGNILDESALADALKNKSIAGAGLDVMVVEPLPASSPLFQCDNVLLTPHIGWKRAETRQRLLAGVAENIDAFFKGSPKNVVN